MSELPLELEDLPAPGAIRDFALIGDCHGAALVGRDGSIEWATLHRFDAEPVFCRMLDAGRGGFLHVRPVGEFTSERAYLEGTNILRTVFRTATGSVALTDFMPVGRTLDAGVHDYVSLSAAGWLVRRIEVLQGEVELRVDYRPSVGFASRAASPSLLDGRVCAGGDAPTLFADLEFTLDGDRARATRTFSRQGTSVLDLVLSDSWVEGERPQDRVDGFLACTRAFWTEWIAYCRYDGPHLQAMHRSALVLKLLTWAPTGAMVAAPTTSLPEDIGGERNWDYRYCWVRDASFALYALAVLGYNGEVRRFQHYLASCATRSLPEVQPMYTIDGKIELAEERLEHLAGHRDSAPVRRGNGAVDQRQIDAYGHMLDLALVYERMGGKIDEQYRRLLRAVAAFVEAHWQEPGQGLWEMRDGSRHFVHDKLMSWVTMDRAATLLEEPRYAEVAARIADEIRRQGIGNDERASGDGAHGGSDAEPGGTGRGALKQAYDGGTDSASLLAPMLGFALDDATLEATLARVSRDLGRGDFLKRYVDDDGLDGEEGAFLLCSAWYADVELALGRTDAARRRIEALLGEANDVGLLAEEIDPGSRDFLGNFPQALTHLGVVMSLVNLDLVERHGREALDGTYADRAERAVSRTFGVRGLIAEVVQSGRVQRVTSSRASMLPWP